MTGIDLRTVPDPDGYEERKALLSEIVTFVFEYTELYGPIALKILSSMFSRKVKRLEKLTVRQYIYRYCDDFATSLNNKGGIIVTLKREDRVNVELKQRFGIHHTETPSQS